MCRYLLVMTETAYMKYPVTTGYSVYGTSWSVLPVGLQLIVDLVFGRVRQLLQIERVTAVERDDVVVATGDPWAFAALVEHEAATAVAGLLDTRRFVQPAADQRDERQDQTDP